MGPLLERGDHSCVFSRAQQKNGGGLDSARTHPVTQHGVPVGAGRLEYHTVLTHSSVKISALRMSINLPLSDASALLEA